MPISAWATARSTAAIFSGRARVSGFARGTFSFGADSQARAASGQRPIMPPDDEPSGDAKQAELARGSLQPGGVGRNPILFRRPVRSLNRTPLDVCRSAEFLR